MLAAVAALTLLPQRLQRLVDVARGCRDALDDGLEQLGHALAGLGADAQDLVGRDAEDVLDLRRVQVQADRATRRALGSVFKWLGWRGQNDSL